MNEAASSLSVIGLFWHADIVVKAVLLVLLAASIWSWAVIVEKSRQLRIANRRSRDYEVRAAAARLAEELWPVQPHNAAEGTAAAVLAAGVAETANEYSTLPESLGERRERIERAMRFVLSGEIRRLEAHLPFLATLGAAAPFIGLFGTVWGIMRSFAAIAAANNTSLAVVAPGIAEALFATAMGLAAAIPAVIFYNRITVELGRFAGRMNTFIGRSGGLLCRVGVEG
jgi:biopolymer transport protein TolQ